jgi:hypothetical protein
MSNTTSRKVKTRSIAVSGKAIHRHSRTSASLPQLSWSLPSGESLAECALKFGFLAPRLLGPSSARVLDLIRFREVQ